MSEMCHYYVDTHRGEVAFIKATEHGEEIVARVPEEAIGDVLPYLIEDETIGTIGVKLEGVSGRMTEMVRGGDNVATTIALAPGVAITVEFESVKKPEP